MTPQFSHNFILPDYLEEALSPFSWSGILSEEFRISIVGVLMASNPVEATKSFSKSLGAISFLDSHYKAILINALERYAKDRDKLRRKPVPPKREYIAEGE